MNYWRRGCGGFRILTIALNFHCGKYIFVWSSWRSCNSFTMTPVHLMEKFCSQNCVTSIDVSQMTRHSCKPNKLRNVNTIRRGPRNTAIQKREINNVKIKIIAFVIISRETTLKRRCVSFWNRVNSNRKEFASFVGKCFPIRAYPFSERDWSTKKGCYKITFLIQMMEDDLCVCTCI